MSIQLLNFDNFERLYKKNLLLLVYKNNKNMNQHVTM